MLAPGALQVEAGYQYDHGGDVDRHTLPVTLARLGLADRLELQVLWAGVTRTEAGGGTSTDANDGLVGVKWRVTAPENPLALALYGGLTVPTGPDSSGTDPVAGVFWSGTAGLDWFGTVLVSESDGETSVDNAIGVAFPIGDTAGGFVEFFGLYGRETGPENYVNGGVTWLLNGDFQLDAYVGAGLNDRSGDFFAGGGIAYRF